MRALHNAAVCALLVAACHPEPAVRDATPPASVAPTSAEPLRRLTQAQLRTALADLLPGVAVPDVAWPAEARVHGFDNDAAAQVPNALLVEAVHALAQGAALAASADPEPWLGCARDDTVCHTAELPAWLARVWRNAVPQPQIDAVVDQLDIDARDAGPQVALALAVQAALEDPAFLYVLAPDAEAAGVATRMALLLWNSVPDQALLDRAAYGELGTPDGREAVAWEMLADPRARRGLQQFHAQWLELDALSSAQPLSHLFPAWTLTADAHAREEFALLVDLATLGPEPTLRTLLLDRTTVDGLAGIYATQDHVLPIRQRAGVLTRAAFLVATGGPLQPSPIHRGVHIAERWLCTPPAPPPAAVEGSVPDGAEASTNRERYAQHVSDATCAGCHATIDPFGFAFEHYDTIGRWRVEDAGQRIDATATLPLGDLAGRPVDGGVDLSYQLADSRSVSDCVATQWWRYAAAGGDADSPHLPDLQQGFADTGGHIPQLIVEIVRSPLFSPGGE
ncbi:MAG: hypothetical protein ACI8PZ_000631 [Myxococcota bacterium]|jgi:hypothetical protein